jgi:hypothetical protein
MGRTLGFVVGPKTRGPKCKISNNLFD